MSKLEISKMLIISTCHISRETAVILSDVTLEIVVYDKDGFGWFICIPEDLEDYKSSIPQDLYECMKIARDNECDWLCLDRDADIVNGLAGYDW